VKPLTRQANTVLSHMRAYPHITQMQADGVYHIRRLASRIDELRVHGYDVETEKAEDAKGQRYTRYSLSKSQKRVHAPLLKPRTSATQYRIEKIEDAYRRYCSEELMVSDYQLDIEVGDFISYLQEYA
jgi:hypothetical protein